MLAGLVVLGTLLASAAIARGRFMRQWADADRKLRVTQAADAMMGRWMADPVARVPLHAAGTLPGAAECDWRTQVVADPAIAALGVYKVRLDVFDRRPESGGGRRDGPALEIEFLVHRAPPATAPAPAKLP